jgi:hypothetical protein
MAKQINILVLLLTATSSFLWDDYKKVNGGVWKAVLPILERMLKDFDLKILDVLKQDESNFTFLVEEDAYRMKRKFQRIAKIHVIKDGETASNKCSTYPIMREFVKKDFIFKFDRFQTEFIEKHEDFKNLSIKFICFAFTERFDEITDPLSVVKNVKKDAENEAKEVVFQKLNKIVLEILSSVYEVVTNEFYNSNLNKESLVYLKSGNSYRFRIRDLENMINLGGEKSGPMNSNDEADKCGITDTVFLAGIYEKLIEEIKDYIPKGYFTSVRSNFVNICKKKMELHNGLQNPQAKFLV